jgi:hypothetical protein
MIRPISAQRCPSQNRIGQQLLVRQARCNYSALPVNHLMILPAASLLECTLDCYKLASPHITFGVQMNKELTTVVIIKLHVSRPRKDFNPPPHPASPYHAALRQTSTALPALLRREFWTVFTGLCSAVRVATVYDIAVALKHAIWWRLLKSRNSRSFIEIES